MVVSPFEAPLSAESRETNGEPEAVPVRDRPARRERGDLDRVRRPEKEPSRVGARINGAGAPFIADRALDVPPSHRSALEPKAEATALALGELGRR